MNKVNRFLLMLIAMVVIMIAAVGIDKGIKYKEEMAYEAEREAYYEEAKAQIADQQAKIQSLSKDPDALLAFIEENELNIVEREVDPDQISDLEEQGAEEASAEAPSDTDLKLEESETGEEEIEAMTVSGNTVSGNTVSGNTVSGNTVSGNSVSGNTISGNTISGNRSSSGLLPSVSLDKNVIFEVVASYQNTIQTNWADKRVISGSTIDFTDKKIACLGDSITEATNLDSMENNSQYSYPARLQEILQAKEVVNLGIGGSSIGRYWDNAFVDRYQEIPEDTDIIIVMGGTNDGFCATETELGTLEERKERTFTGDLDELIRGLKEHYPEAEIILVTPLPNVLHDLLRKEREELLPQSAFVKVMKALAEEYELPVIDLNNANFLDTHDAAVIHALMPDGVHGNPTGYKMLAEHIGAELIQIEMAKQTLEEETAEEE